MDIATLKLRSSSARAPRETSMVLAEGAEPVTVRALPAAAVSAIYELVPRPSPPVKPDPTKGSLAPWVPDENDPAYVRAYELWTRRAGAAKAAAAIGLEVDGVTLIGVAREVMAAVASGKPAPESARAWAEQAVQAVMAELSVEQINRICWESDRLGGGWSRPEEVAREVAQLVVPDELITADDEAQAGDGWTLPERYGVTVAYQELRVRERFGLGAAAWDELPPHERTRLLAYERVREAEEQRWREMVMRLAGVAVAAV